MLLQKVDRLTRVSYARSPGGVPVLTVDRLTRGVPVLKVDRLTRVKSVRYFPDRRDGSLY